MVPQSSQTEAEKKIVHTVHDEPDTWVQNGGGERAEKDKNVKSDGRYAGFGEVKKNGRDPGREHEEGEHGGAHEEKVGKQVSQMYVKVADGKTILLDVRLSDFKRKIRSQRMSSDSDVCLTFKERVLRGRVLRGRCHRNGVEGGSTVHVMERLRGGGTHPNK